MSSYFSSVKFALILSVGTMLGLVVFESLVVNDLKDDFKSARIEANASRASLDALQHKWDLAIEFGVSPLTIEVVQKFGQVGTGEAFRYVKTSNDFSYLLLSIIKVESAGNARAYNAVGHAYGLTQLQLPTARAYDPKVTANRLLDVETNVTIAAQHLRYLLKQCHGNPGLAVSAWYWGVSVCSAPAAGYANQVFQAALSRNSQGENK